jgi:hypothetical protein
MPVEHLQTLTDALHRLREQPHNVRPFSQLARSQTPLLIALPPRYTTVLLNLLDRLESSALFSEESCSFSQRELLDSLQMWLDKARQTLLTPPATPPGGTPGHKGPV